MAGVGLGCCLALLPGLDPWDAHVLGAGVLVPGVGARLLLIEGHWVCLPLFLKCCCK